MLAMPKHMFVRSDAAAQAPRYTAPSVAPASLTASSGDLRGPLGPQRAAQSSKKHRRQSDMNGKSRSCRNRQQGALVRATDSIQACAIALSQLKARRVTLLAANRELHHRNREASTSLLSATRAYASHPSTTHRRHAAPPRPPRRIYAPLALADVLPLTPPEPPHDTVAAVAANSAAGATPPSPTLSDADLLGMSECNTVVVAAEIGSSRVIEERLLAAKRAAAAAAGVAPEAVWWVLQSPHTTPDGAALSYTSKVMTHRCLASMYATYFISVLEEALLAEVPPPGECRAPEATTHSHTGTVDALDTALHGAHSLSASKLQLRCGVDGSAPVAAVVPHLVSAICRSTRVFLPRPLWLQACGLYTHFMAGLTKGRPLGAGVCPHVGAVDGSKIHAVNTCPRCCVFAHIFKTLRAEIVSAVEGEVWPVEWPVERVTMSALRERWGQLYGFCVLATSQCMADQPVAFRQLACTMLEGKGWATSQEQLASLEVFRRLQLSREQLEAAAEAWRVWRQTRATLDRHLAAALQPLSALLDLPDLMLDDGTPRSTHSMRSIFRLGWDTARMPARKGMLPPLLPPRGGSTHTEAPRSASAQAGADICICVECAVYMSQRLLGGSGRMTACALRALGEVAEVHRCDAAVGVEQLRGIRMPGVIFTAEQYALQTDVMLRQGLLTDWLGICKNAAQKLRHSELAARLQLCMGTM